MIKIINIIILSLLLNGCKSDNKIAGNWSFCDNGEYREVFINDSTFRYYFIEFGFIPMIYKTISNDSILLYNASKQLKFAGNISKIEKNQLLINLVVLETNEEKKLELIRFTGEEPMSNSNDVEEYYEWLNKVFIPEFEKRKSNFNCQQK